MDRDVTVSVRLDAKGERELSTLEAAFDREYARYEEAFHRLATM